MAPRAARAIVFGGALLTLAAWVGLARFTMPYTSDSAVYIEAAEHFAAGQGLLVTPYSVEPVETDLHPLAIFPPGYPFLIWAATRLGLDAARAALAVQGACLAALPILFFLLFRRLVAPSTAVVASLVCTWTSPIVLASLHAWSDVPFLAFALLSFELLFRGIAGDRIGPTFGAGVAAAFACLTRNVGYALVGSELFGLAAAIALRPTVRRAWWRGSAAYGSGFLGVYGWWLLRNLLVVGRLQPYDFDPSDLSLADNVEHLARALVTAFVGGRAASFALGLGALAVLALTALSVHEIQRLRERRDESTLVVAALVWSTLAAYGVAGAGLVVLARTRYGWGEYINARHILQYHWILIIACAARCARGVRQRPTPQYRGAAAGPTDQRGRHLAVVAGHGDTFTRLVRRGRSLSDVLPGPLRNPSLSGVARPQRWHRPARGIRSALSSRWQRATASVAAAPRSHHGRE